MAPAALAWGIRVASDSCAGGGHLMRMRVLAQALTRSGGARVIFFTDPANPRPNSIEAAGFDCRAEAGPAAVDAVVAACRSNELVAAVCDSYTLSDAAIETLAHAVPVTAFRDGTPPGPELLSVDINPGAAAAPNRIAGPAYAPVDPIFLKARAKRGRQRCAGDPDKMQVLVSFGLRDSGGMAGAVLRALKAGGLACDVTAAAGGGSPGYTELVDIAARDPAIRLEFDPPDMSVLYAAADLAIGAPGGSQFERACCGLPTILLAQNKRQTPLALAWEAEGAATFIERASDLPARLAALAADRASRTRMSTRATTLVDGRGAARLAAALHARLATQTA